MAFYVGLRDGDGLRQGVFVFMNVSNIVMAVDLKGAINADRKLDRAGYPS
ncbi:MAG: hypothetical protein OET90_02000 [Desulfuromonadales bacterium]|nr:hypothetical protein [Desulfuromonadales bacterium]